MMIFFFAAAVVCGAAASPAPRLYCPAQPLTCDAHVACSSAALNASSCACEAAAALQARYCNDLFHSWLPSMWETAVGIEAVTNFAAYGAPLANQSAVLQIVAQVARAKDSVLLIAEDPDAYDDLLWYAIAFARLFEVTRDASFLQQSRLVFDYVYLESWDTATCGGGFYWSSHRDYKNAITNELGIVAAYRLARLLPQPNRYGAIGDAALSWFLASGMINAQYLVNDGLFIQNCTNNNQTAWTYNQGVIYLGLVYGAQRHPSSAAAYAQLATRMFGAVAQHMTNKNGVLLEPLPGDPYNDSDQFVFKGIYTRYLRYLVDKMRAHLSSATIKAIGAFLHTQMRSAVQNDMSGALYGVFWEGPFTARFNNKTAATQISAVDLLTANL